KDISKSPAIFDNAKLKWMNGEYIRKLSLDEFHELAMEQYKKVLHKDFDFKFISELLHTRCELLNDIPEQIDFLEELPEYTTDLYVHKKMKSTVDTSLENLEKVLPVLESIDEKDWTMDNIHDKVFELIKSLEIKNGQMLWPIRTALSGKSFTPGGAFEIAILIGKEESLKRMHKGIELLKA
ncbi:MAG: glutamate--tRNA ligase, partial [Clostridium butyricum]